MPPTNQPIYRPPIEDSPASSGAMETQYQLQVLQQEVLDLRGLVEELTYQQKRSQATQEERYLELDARLQNLQQQLSGGAPAGSTAAGAEIVDTSQEPRISTGSAGEKALYETALDLIRNRQYELAVTQLQAVISQYPEGAYTANAYYWLGEVHAAKPEPDYEKARQALAQVITFFPNDPKVPDAAFKLGKVYHLMGDCSRARDLLQQVARDHRGKSVAGLAEAYLRDHVSC